MIKNKPCVVHENEREFESWSHKGYGTARWKTFLSADRTSTSGLVLGVAEIEPGDSGAFRNHYHDFAEAYYILSGEGIVKIAGQDFVVRPGTTTFMPKGAEHVVVNTGSETLRFLYVFPADSFAQINYRLCDA
jgi:mannose-6-phosphate isomerase-like protein (cupin superfamily)